MTTPGDSFYYSSDPYGNVADLTDSSGATRWAYQYEPFGQIRSATNVSGSAPVNPFQYASQYTDTVTGLSDMRARNYDPTTGTFLNQDPAGASSPMATSWYAYANNNPLAYSDPSGLSSVLGDIYNAGVTALGDAANAVGDAATAVGQVVNTVVVQPTVQLAKTDYNCMTGNGGSAGACTAAAVQTGLLLLPGVDGIAAGADAVAASTSLFRASLRENASNIASAITDGVYKLATDETGEFKPWATGRAGSDGAGSLGIDDMGAANAQAIADTMPPRQSLSQRISEAAPNPASAAPEESGDANLAAEDGGAIARDFSFGDPGEGALGSTDKFGNITIRPGLSDQDFAETLRHETVHSVLSPSWGPMADARMWLYSKSSAYRYAEEALAEGYAVRSVGRGLTFPIAIGYVSPLGLGLELGGLGAAGYGTYEAVK